MDIKLDQVKGIGPSTLRILRNQHLWSTYDLVSYLPRGYEDFSITDFHQAKHKDIITILGVVVSEPKLIRGPKADRVVFKVDALHEQMDIIAFGKGYLVKQLVVGDEVQIKGTYHFYRHQINATSVIKAEKKQSIKPHYGIEGLHDKTIQNLIEAIKENNQVTIYENIPKELLKTYHMPSRQEAFFMLHLPKTFAEIEYAKRRMKYEEAFYLQLRLMGNQPSTEKRLPKAYDIIRVKHLIDQLPFTLTQEQKEAVNDIFRDFKKDHATYRLIQGDVGSGKTIVSILAAYAIITAGEQVSLMAPTELLAQQHYQLFTSIIKDSKIALLTGKTKNKDDVKKKIKLHEFDMVIGTHAMIEEDVIFHHLGLVIIDEQHKFGVATRESLMMKAKSKDVIYLTATPIPRTLAMVAFGESRVSIIKEKPKERKPVKTHYITKDAIHQLFEQMHAALSRKEHVFVVVPAIDSDKVTDNIDTLYQELTREFTTPIYVLHGKLNPNEQELAMQSYVKNPGSILLATTMIEVGIDIPTATLMAIFNADRFGLSQLHQLRGRIGRSHLPSQCFVISEKEDIERLEILSKTDDGFALSEYDLHERGPGDFLGLDQSGFFQFKFLDLIQDHKILLEAQKNIQSLLNEPDFKTNPKYKYLVKAMTPSPMI